MNPAARRVAVIGGGWAGLAAAVDLCAAGHAVTVYEMAPHLGGRARSLHEGPNNYRLDNGQHILIGAYTACLGLMRRVGLDIDRAFLRQPLRLRYPQHEGLQLKAGQPLLSFARAILGYKAWPMSARLQLMAVATVWLAKGFRCEPGLSVAQLCAGLPDIVRQELMDPLCVAALNTPAPQASAEVFLRVLHDALLSGPGSADLLLPRKGLSQLLAEPAQHWLLAHGANIELGARVQSVQHGDQGWRLDIHAARPASPLHFDQVVMACPATQAAQLCADIAPTWAQTAQALRFEPIITVYLHAPGSSLPAAMVALIEGPQAPAQFAFDLGQLGHAPGLFAFVVSGAAPWVEQGLEATGACTLQQARREFSWHSEPSVYRVLAEKRATFACTPGLQRPAAQIAEGLWAAGDYIAGPYPATLEGAVRSGQAAALACITAARN
ncbi:hydroxysqualene dehydroxylase HpnE [Paucibacter sp. AS339]|uniref:hydroxysqualene dehydroxylase HpnE n=1 Tax=Paucibacter hankyongi TaxID=3133434 RepID=UPI00309CE770